MAENFVHSFKWDPVKARGNVSKHGVDFSQAATVFEDPLALTTFDAAHSDSEARWFSLGSSRDGALLTISHTFEPTGATSAQIRIISARRATRREREFYENEPRCDEAMSQTQDPQDDDMPAEIDFAGAMRGKFHRVGAVFDLPVYLEPEVQARLAALANARGVELSSLVNEFLRKDLERLEA